MAELPSWATKGQQARTRQREEADADEEDEPEAKRAFVKDLESSIGKKDTKLIIEVLLKGFLSHEQTLRQLTGERWRCSILKQDNELVVALKERNTKIREQRESVQVDPAVPTHLLTFLEFTKAVGNLRSGALLSNDVKAWIVFQEKLVTAAKDHSEITDYLGYFRIKDTYFDEKKKSKKKKDKETKLLFSMQELLINVSKERVIIKENRWEGAEDPEGRFMVAHAVAAEDVVVDMHEATLRALKAMGGDNRKGAPPRGQLERLAQRMIDTHFKKKE